jgi:alpha-L-rhamnosidase
MTLISNLRFEHYHTPNILGVHERTPRLSWTFQNAPGDFKQVQYEIEVFEMDRSSNAHHRLYTSKIDSSRSALVPWPHDPLQSRQKIYARVRAWGENATVTPWSESMTLETGLLERRDWLCERIAAPWGAGTSAPDAEQLYRKQFQTSHRISLARLYITAQGVYETELNGRRVSDYFLAPGWTAYHGRLQYQTYDVTGLLRAGEANCLGVRVAEGWFCGRLGFRGGRRNIWGSQTALMVQLEITYEDLKVDTIVSDGSWVVARGPIRLAEIYDGEKYDGTLEIPNWSSPEVAADHLWEPVLVLSPLPVETTLAAGFSEPVRRVEVVKPIECLTTPSGKTVLDFGQNLVGYLRIHNIHGPRGHKITFSHAEVLEHGELGVRPLRFCKATDEYTLKGDKRERYEPRFTFHGFRYAQIDGWVSDEEIISSVEAVVCHTDMKPAGSFSSSHTLLNKLYQNVTWGMRGNFVSVPTDCPQRDERLGWSGDLAVFAPTATLLYDCFGMLRNWLIDVEYDQAVLNGVPALVTPDVMCTDPNWCRKIPCAVWNDVTILAPWALYEETGDITILQQQYNSMKTYIGVVQRDKGRNSHLWDPSIFQLGVGLIHTLSSMSNISLSLNMINRTGLTPLLHPKHLGRAQPTRSSSRTHSSFAVWIY